MKLNFGIVFCVGVLACTLGHTKVGSTTPVNSMKSSALSEKSLTEELTGKKSVTQISPATNLKKAPLPVQHYFAGQRAAEQKNYIMAIKHYNTVLKKYPRSNQVKLALLAKAKVYKEMGLQTQAVHNLQMAQQKVPMKRAAATSQAAKTVEKTKSIK